MFKPAMLLLTTLTVAAAAYLLGSIPFGLIFLRVFYARDIRLLGSGNIGATNVRRAAGTTAGVATLLCDMAKGALPALVAVSLSQRGAVPLWWPGVVALAAVCGHMFPLYLRFKPSGKGVATTIGAFAMLNPIAALAVVLLWVLLVGFFRRVSVGSMAGAAALAPALWLASHDPMLTASGAVAAFLIIVRHKENLHRLRQGTEPTLGRRR